MRDIFDARNGDKSCCIVKTIEPCSADADGRRFLQSERRHLLVRCRHWRSWCRSKRCRCRPKESDTDRKNYMPTERFRHLILFVSVWFFLSASASLFSASASPVLASQDADADVAIAEIYARRRRHCKTLPWWGTIKHKWLTKLAISQQVLNIFPWFNVRRKAHYLPVLTHTQA